MALHAYFLGFAIPIIAGIGLGYVLYKMAQPNETPRLEYRSERIRSESQRINSQSQGNNNPSQRINNRSQRTTNNQSQSQQIQFHEPEQDKNICVICLFEIEPFKGFPINCGHEFHLECRNTMLERKTSKCPICREEIIYEMKKVD